MLGFPPGLFPIVSAHFWLTREAVPLSLEEVARLDEERARLLLASMRWGDSGKQVCPSCGQIDNHHNIRTRRQWRCKGCQHTFSVTSGTPFADHKISHRKLLLAFFAFVINHKGLAALALRRIIGGQYRTAFTLLHKIREALMVTASKTKLTGVVEIDGGHFSGKKRKGRKKKKSKPEDKNTVPTKYAQHRTKSSASAFPFHPNRRIVIALREIDPEKTDAVNPHNGKPIGKGARRTVVAICRSENSADIEALVKKHVDGASLIRTDELPAYGNLKLMGYEHEAVNHSEEFSTDDGVNENQAESFFSRMRRATIGIYHRITPRYMLDYASEMAWREDARRRSTKNQLVDLFSQSCRAGISDDWINYCRGNKRKIELLFQAVPTPASSS